MPDALQDPHDAVRTADATSEVSRANEALAAVGVWLGQHAVKVGGDAQAVLEAQALMAGDPALAKDVSKRIHDGKTAERAVFEAFGAFQAVFEEMGGYMGERSADLADVSRRVIAHLRGVVAPGVPNSEIPFILVADNLAPADTAMLDFNRVLGLITRDGGPTSHTAILARAKSIPAIVGVAGADNIANGTQIVVDAGASTVTIDASLEQVAAARAAVSAGVPVAQAARQAGIGRSSLYAHLSDPGHEGAAVGQDGKIALGQGGRFGVRRSP
jgi:phosphotransferase system enzyme I (PtsI)